MRNTPRDAGIRLCLRRAAQLCWNTGKQISLVDKTQEDARQKLKNITVLAYDSLHPELKDRFVVSRANSGEFGVRFFEYEAAQTSTMFAGTHARGGSNFFVWISEWGVIQAEDLRRSEEILTGAIPSAKDGLVVVETTWRGGRGGHLWDIVKKALETPEEQKHTDDWRVVFFPWQDDPAYCDAEPQPSRKRPSVTSPTNRDSAMGRSPGIKRHETSSDFLPCASFLPCSKNVPNASRRRDLR